MVRPATTCTKLHMHSSLVQSRRAQAAGLIAVLLATALFATNSARAQTPATYTGSSGSYANPDNWDIGAVPLNSGASLYDVSIGSDKSSVTFDVATGSHSLSALSVGSGTTFILNPGHELSVLGNFNLTGELLVSGPGAAFDFTGLGQLDLNFASVTIDGGAHAILGSAGPARDLTLDGQNGASLRSDGVGSRLDLRGFRSITRNGEGVWIDARNSGVTDLPNLEKVAHLGTTYFGLYSANAGGMLALPALAEVYGPNLFEAINGGLIDATSADPAGTRTLALTGHNFSQFNADGTGSRINFSSFDTLDCFTEGTGFSANNTGILDLSRLTTTTSHTQFGPGLVARSGGRIELSSLRHIDGAHSFDAESGALLSLASPGGAPLRSLTVAGAHSVFFRAVDAGSRLNFASIDTLRLQGHEAVFYAEVGGIGTFPDLAVSEVTSGDAISFNALTGGSLVLPRLAHLTGAHSFRAAEGGSISTLASGDSPRDLTVDRDPATGMSWFEAQGSGSFLDFSGFRSLMRTGSGLFLGTSGPSTASLANLVSSVSETGNTTEFVARDGGQLELTALTTLVGPHSIRAESGSTVATLDPAAPTATRALLIDQTASHDGTYFNGIGSGSVLDLGGFRSLETVNSAGLWIGAEQSGRTELPNLESVTASDTWVSSLNAHSLGTITLGALATIHGSHFFTASSGGLITMAAPAGVAPRTLAITGTKAATFRAEDAGSRIDFSSINTFDLQADELTLFAERGGTVAFPDLATSANATGRLIAHYAYDGGTIELPALTAIDGEHSFTAGHGGLITAGSIDPETPRFLTLTGPNSVSFRAADTGSVVNLSAVGVLFSANDTTEFSAEIGGKVSLSGLVYSAAIDEHLVGFYADGGSITLDAVSSLTGAHIFACVGGGRISFGLAGGPTRSLTISNTLPPLAAFQADGDGSVVDLSVIESITHTGMGSWTRALNGGVVDLSRLSSSVAPATGVAVEYSAVAGGTLRLGALATIGAHRIAASGTDANLEAAGLDLGNATSLELGAGSVLRLGGSFRFAGTEEHAFSPLEGTIAFTGSGTFEVGGLDAGAADPGNNGNFGFGRLIVGAAGAPANVALVDLVDNGNRTGPEALYLHGAGRAGLSLLDGSELCLNRLPVYVAQPGGTWMHLNSLFAGGVVRIPYDGGYLRLAPALGYADWSTLFGLPAGQDAPGDDPNHDGTSNLLCYAFGLDPLDTAPVTDGTNPGLPRIRVVGPQLEVTFTGDSSRPEAALVVESSTDLVHWNTCGDTVIAATGTMQVRQSAIALSGQPRLFARVRATLISP